MNDDAIQKTAIVMYSPDEAIQQAKNKSDIVVRLQDEKILKPNLDFGIIPGTGKKAKPTLLKPGAEKLCSAFGLEPRFVEVYAERNYDKEFFAFQYRCELYHIQTGLRIASADGECNSKESKYRWRWLWPNEVDGLDTTGMKTKKTKSGQTQYRIANDDVCSQVNTILKMAQKRALVAAVLIGTNASEHFTQDLEDMRVFGDSEPGENEQGNGNQQPPPLNGAGQVIKILELKNIPSGDSQFIAIKNNKDIKASVWTRELLVNAGWLDRNTDLLNHGDKIRYPEKDCPTGVITYKDGYWNLTEVTNTPLDTAIPQEPSTTDAFADDKGLVAAHDEGDLGDYGDTPL